MDFGDYYFPLGNETVPNFLKKITGCGKFDVILTVHRR